MRDPLLPSTPEGLALPLAPRRDAPSRRVPRLARAASVGLAAVLSLPLAGLPLAGPQDPAPRPDADAPGSASPGAAAAEDAVPVRAERADGAWVVTAGGEPFTTLHLTGGRTPCQYPLHAPGGARVTRGFPLDPRPGEAHDHPHHRSFWLAHGDVQGVDFWHDPEARIALRGEPRVRELGPDLELRADLDWVAPDGRVLLRETRTWTWRARGDERVVDVDLVLRNALDEDLTFGDTKEGFFALRLAPQLRVEGEHAAGSLRNSRGTVGKACWGQRAAWLHAEGPARGPGAGLADPDGGRDAEPDADRGSAGPAAVVGVTLHDHPENLRHPTWWHARAYGLLAANPFGRHDFEGAPEGAGDHVLAPGAALHQRYRVELHRGPRDAAFLAGRWTRFARGEDPRPEAAPPGTERLPERGPEDDGGR